MLESGIEFRGESCTSGLGMADIAGTRSKPETRPAREDCEREFDVEMEQTSWIGRMRRLCAAIRSFDHVAEGGSRMSPLTRTTENSENRRELSHRC